MTTAFRPANRLFRIASWGAAPLAAMARGHLFAMLALIAVWSAGPAAAQEIRILALGTSLTAGFGLADEEGFVPQLEAALLEAGYEATVINAGVSGDTTAGGRARLDWSLAEPVTHAIVELGSNDALRGLSPDQTKANLDAILTRLGEEGIPVLLAGMLAPRNLGPDYAQEFDAIYPALADKHGAQLYPFFLDGVAVERDLNQADGIHPNKAGVGVIVERLLPSVIALIDPAVEAPEVTLTLP